MLLDLLSMDVAMVGSVQILSGHRAVVKFGSKTVFLDFVGHYNGRSFQLPEDGGSVIILDRSGTT